MLSTYHITHGFLQGVGGLDHAGSVQEDDLHVVVRVHALDALTCCLGLIRDDRDLLA